VRGKHGKHAARANTPRQTEEMPTRRAAAAGARDSSSRRRESEGQAMRGSDSGEDSSKAAVAAAMGGGGALRGSNGEEEEGWVATGGSASELSERPSVHLLRPRGEAGRKGTRGTPTHAHANKAGREGGCGEEGGGRREEWRWALGPGWRVATEHRTLTSSPARGYE
jgi:hypothetical protein